MATDPPTDPPVIVASKSVGVGVGVGLGEGESGVVDVEEAVLGGGGGSVLASEWRRARAERRSTGGAGKVRKKEGIGGTVWDLRVHERVQGISERGNVT